MRSIDEIYARTVILQCLDDRCRTEWSMIDGKRSLIACEKDRTLILKWLQDKGYFPFTTEEERDLFDTPVGFKPFTEKEITDINIRCKAMDVLMWVIEKTSEIPPLDMPAINDNHKALGISKIHSFEKAVSRSSIRSESEISLQADIAFLWNWRLNSIDIKATKGTDHHINDMISEKFEDRYNEALEHIRLHIAKNSRSSNDFVLYNLVVRELYKNQIYFVKNIAYWRDHAFRWILGEVEW